VHQDITLAKLQDYIKQLIIIQRNEKTKTLSEIAKDKKRNNDVILGGVI
jgi:hypothetical protein